MYNYLKKKVEEMEKSNSLPQGHQSIIFNEHQAKTEEIHKSYLNYFKQTLPTLIKQTDRLVENVVSAESQCDLKSEVLPLVYEVTMKQPASDVIGTQNQIQEILSQIQELSAKGAKVLLTFPAQ